MHRKALEVYQGVHKGLHKAHHQSARLSEPHASSTWFSSVGLVKIPLSSMKANKFQQSEGQHPSGRAKR